MSDCATIRARIDAWLDGELTPTEHEEVTTHLEQCTACRQEVAGLRALLASADALPRAILPHRDLWRGIEARIAATPLAAPILPAAQPARFGPAWRVAAAIGFILLGAGLASLWHAQRGPGDFAATQARYAAATADLAERLTQDSTALPPATRAVVERNLAIVDAAIREAESALRADPGSPALQQMLVARYEQRLALLRHAARRDRVES